MILQFVLTTSLLVTIVTRVKMATEHLFLYRQFSRKKNATKREKRED
jgi:C4-dicarboxylate transporter